MESLINPIYLDGFARIMVAALLGMAIGLERSIAQKTAGIRTYSLISLGAALFVVISEYVVTTFHAAGVTTFDPLRVAAQIVSGIGFVGAGLVLTRENSRIKGLTTAAGLWVSAGVGMAAGFGLYAIAVFATILVLFVFSILWYVDRKYLNFQLFNRLDNNRSRVVSF
ncbi:MAG: MgtC/SapB family protein [Candidatus Paceibacterota bacterium]|jgi:putative Mg2+ transporter-C (MgtC) family protein